MSCSVFTSPAADACQCLFKASRICSSCMIISLLVDCFSHFVPANDPQAYARGYNPVPSGRGFRNNIADRLLEIRVRSHTLAEMHFETQRALPVRRRSSPRNQDIYGPAKSSLIVRKAGEAVL